MVEKHNFIFVKLRMTLCEFKHLSYISFNIMATPEITLFPRLLQTILCNSTRYIHDCFHLTSHLQTLSSAVLASYPAGINPTDGRV